MAHEVLAPKWTFDGIIGTELMASRDTSFFAGLIKVNGYGWLGFVLYHLWLLITVLSSDERTCLFCSFSLARSIYPSPLSLFWFPFLQLAQEFSFVPRVSKIIHEFWGVPQKFLPSAPPRGWSDSALSVSRLMC